MKLIKSYFPNNNAKGWEFYDLGVVEYSDGLEIQNKEKLKVSNNSENKLLLLEHNPVITLGRRTKIEHLLESKEEIVKKGIDIFEIDRGGSATYHGPGQLVGYIICKSSRLGGIHNLINLILKSINNVMDMYGISSYIDNENPGIWTDTPLPRKLAALGMSNNKGVTMHGFAINLDMPLTGFSIIVPCGLTLPVSTIAIETGEKIGMIKLKEDICDVILAELKKYYNE